MACRWPRSKGAGISAFSVITSHFKNAHSECEEVGCTCSPRDPGRRLSDHICFLFSETQSEVEEEEREREKEGRKSDRQKE